MVMVGARGLRAGFGEGVGPVSPPNGGDASFCSAMLLPVETLDLGVLS